MQRLDFMSGKLEFGRSNGRLSFIECFFLFGGLNEKSSFREEHGLFAFIVMISFIMSVCGTYIREPLVKSIEQVHSNISLL